MKYGEAFSRMGYTLEIPRTDWSASNEHGVCVTLWRQKIDWKASPIMMDSRIHGSRLGEWEAKPGNIKRRKHLGIAIEKFDGWIDAIIVDGNSDSGVDKATPWNPDERKGLRWRVVEFEPDTGHLKVCALPWQR